MKSPETFLTTTPAEYTDKQFQEDQAMALISSTALIKSHTEASRRMYGPEVIKALDQARHDPANSRIKRPRLASKRVK